MDVVVVWFFCAFACAAVASYKGRSVLGWFFLGGIFGIFALIVALVMAKGGREPCPACREPVLREATKCPHCQTEIVRHRTSIV